MAPKFFEIDTETQKEVNQSDRCPFDVPDDAVVNGDDARWSEVVIITDTTYDEKINDDRETIGKANIQFRVTEHSDSAKNVGKKFTAFNTINFSQLKERTNQGQVDMSIFSLRRLRQCLQAAGLIETADQMKSPGEWFFHEKDAPSKLAGITVRVQIQQSLDKNGELQQQVRRFTKYEGA